MSFWDNFWSAATYGNVTPSQAATSRDVLQNYDLGESMSTGRLVSRARSGQQVSVLQSDAGTTVPVSSYLNADLAAAYGMSNNVAYQEAMANTSYQRAVKDLQAAGLNPALITGGFNGAGGVAYLDDQGVATGVSSAKGAHTNYKTLNNIGAIVAGLGTYAVTKSISKSLTAATLGSKILGAAGNLLDGVD